MTTKMQEFRRWLKKKNWNFSPCNCGGPAMGTDHSPDCDFVRSEEDLWECWLNEMYDVDSERFCWCVVE